MTLLSEKIDSLKPIPFINIKRQIKYILYCSITMVLGLILKLVLPKYNRKNAHHAIMTGFIPGMSRNHTLYSIFINFAFLVIITYISLKESDSREQHYYGNSKFLLLIKTKTCYIFQNLFSILAFYILYNHFIQPIYVALEHNFKISGHYSSCMFSNYVFVNLMEIASHLAANHIHSSFFKKLEWVLLIVVINNFFQLVFTFFIYHEILECLTSFAINTVYIVFLSFIDLDSIIFAIVNGNTVRNI